MRNMFSHFKQQTSTLIGAALLLLVADGFILIFRLAGLPRPTAVYAGLLAFTVSGSLLARHIFRTRPLKKTGEDHHA